MKQQTGSYAHKSPRLKTINLELRDFETYVGSEFELDKLELDFSFSFGLKKENLLQIFIHLRHRYRINNKENKEFKLSLHHSDHLINFEFAENQDSSLGFDVEYLAHLLGTAIIMVKGCYDNFTKGNKLNEIALPIMRPIDLVKEQYKETIKDKILTLNIESKNQVFI